MSSLFKILISLSLLLFPGLAVSQNSVDKDCLIELKVMRGTGSRHKSSKPRYAAEIRSKDVRRQLAELPYASYRMTSSKSKRVPLGREARFRVVDVEGGKHSIRVQPLSVNPNRKINMRLKWRGPRGEKYVSTKMRIASKRCMTVGTDGKKDDSTIISVRPDCD